MNLKMLWQKKTPNWARHTKTFSYRLWWPLDTSLSFPPSFFRSFIFFHSTPFHNNSFRAVETQWNHFGLLALAFHFKMCSNKGSNFFMDCETYAYFHHILMFHIYFFILCCRFIQHFLLFIKWIHNVNYNEMKWNDDQKRPHNVPKGKLNAHRKLNGKKMIQIYLCKPIVCACVYAVY